MAAFPSQDPDEGYSEDPLNPSFSGASDASALASGSRVRLPADPADVPAYLATLSVAERRDLTLRLLNSLPTSYVVEIIQHQSPRLYINFVQYLPPEVCLKVLGFLDPVSLINVAKSCRTWHDLALDRKLWEKLYHMEGWQADYVKVKKWEDSWNERASTAISSLHRVRSSEDGHTYKKRAISEDDDLEMTDVDRLRTEDSMPSMTGNSIFGSPASSFTGFGRSSATPQPGDTDMDRSASGSKSRSADRGYGHDVKGKGRASPLSRAAPSNESSMPPLIPVDSPGVSHSDSWAWDASSSKYKLNWKYVYTMRRRLERNWELGKFSNFQFPHPDFMHEGHRECIYSLQFDSEYLVSGSRDRTIRIWSLLTQRLQRPPLEGHTGSVLCLQFDADPKEDLIVSGSSDSDVILWRFSTGEMIQKLTKAHSESVLNVKFDKRILVTCSKDKSIKIFNRRPLKYGDPGYGDAELVYSVPTQLRDYGYINPMDQLPVKPPYTMIGVLDGHGAAVNAVQICEDEVVSASGDRNIKVWDWAKQVCIRTVVGHSKGIACVQYDGRRIVSGSSDNEVKVFDRFTGLEVASLRAHQNLVRTVQAGFGDLPYSAEEDKKEAKRIDNEYFKAVEAGLVSSFQEQGSRRSRPRNAGSSKPEDITAYGANLPPGGGGGKYARIVSGSYDQTIIVWRRDKEGVWKDAHHLRQEEAAAAAQSQVQNAARAASQAAAQTMFANITQGPQASSGRAADASTATNLPRTTIESTANAAPTPQSAQAFMNLIDIVVPQGPAHLRTSLAMYPTLMAYNAHIQAAIAREPNPRTRSDLRAVLTASLLESQMSQARARVAAIREPRHGDTFVPPTLPSLSALTGGPGPSSGHESTPPPGLRSEESANGRRRQRNPQATASNLEPLRSPVPQTAEAASQAQTPTPQVQGHLHVQGDHPRPQGQAQDQQGQAQPTQPGAPVQTQATPVPGQGPQAAPDGAHHPHIANAETGPARVFKLQYDARRIICCSQTSVIVGWDFVNNDPELGKVAELFKTVE